MATLVYLPLLLDDVLFSLRNADLRETAHHSHENCVQQVGYPRTHNRGLSKDIHEAEIVQAPNKCVCTVRECERVAPEKPLEGCYCERHQGKPE